MRNLLASLSGFVIFLILLTEPVPAAGEVRLKLDLDYTIPLQRDNSALAIKPMLRTEQRFRENGVVLNKVFTGLRFDVSPALKIQAYYAHKDLYYSDHQEIHMLVFDLILQYRLKSLTFKERNGNEWHSPSGFYRYRQYFELLHNVGVLRSAIWLSEEFRVDSDQRRVNQNDIRLGINFKLKDPLKIRLYYNLESKRRLKITWEANHIFGIMIIQRY